MSKMEMDCLPTQYPHRALRGFGFAMLCSALLWAASVRADWEAAGDGTDIVIETGNYSIKIAKDGFRYAFYDAAGEAVAFECDDKTGAFRFEINPGDDYRLTDDN